MDPDPDRVPAHHEALARLLPALVHRINNWMLVARGRIDAAKHAGALQGELGECELDRVTHALQQLALLAKPHAPDEREIPLERTLAGLRALLPPFADSLRVALALPPETTAVVRADGPRLEQALIALLVATIEGASESSPARCRLRLRRGGRHATLVVTRTGGGPSSVERARQRAVDPALGAGALPGRARALGGAASFRFGLARLGSPEDRAPAALGRPRRRRVLLVEPEGMLADLVVAVLAEVDADVHVCATLADAVLALEGERFDAVLVDREASAYARGGLRRVSAAANGVPVAALGSADAGVPALAKPFRPHELVDFARSLLGLGAAR